MWSVVIGAMLVVVSLGEYLALPASPKYGKFNPLRQIEFMLPNRLRLTATYSRYNISDYIYGWTSKRSIRVGGCKKLKNSESKALVEWAISKCKADPLVNLVVVNYPLDQSGALKMERLPQIDLLLRNSLRDSTNPVIDANDIMQSFGMVLTAYSVIPGKKEGYFAAEKTAKVTKLSYFVLNKLFDDTNSIIKISVVITTSGDNSPFITSLVGYRKKDEFRYIEAKIQNNDLNKIPFGESFISNFPNSIITELR